MPIGQGSGWSSCVACVVCTLQLQFGYSVDIQQWTSARYSRDAGSFSTHFEPQTDYIELHGIKSCHYTRQTSLSFLSTSKCEDNSIW